MACGCRTTTSGGRWRRAGTAFGAFRLTIIRPIDFANVKFAAKLFALDGVKVPVNQPRELEPAELRRDFLTRRHNRGRADRWMLVVGKDGLRPR